MLKRDKIKNSKKLLPRMHYAGLWDAKTNQKNFKYLINLSQIFNFPW